MQHYLPPQRTVEAHGRVVACFEALAGVAGQSARGAAPAGQEAKGRILVNCGNRQSRRPKFLIYKCSAHAKWRNFRLQVQRDSRRISRDEAWASEVDGSRRGCNRGEDRSKARTSSRNDRQRRVARQRRKEIASPGDPAAERLCECRRVIFLLFADRPCRIRIASMSPAKLASDN